MKKEQEVFDKVIKHLRAQGERSWDPSTHMCRYRDDCGRACAVGILMTDEEAADADRAVKETDANYDILSDKAEGLGVQYTFLASLQSIHDDEFHWDVRGFNDAGERALKALAQKCDLNYRSPKKALD